MRKVILFLSLALLGCASKVAVRHNIRRTLPVIIDESTTAGKTFGIGFAGKAGSGQNDTTEYYYTEDVNETYEAYEKPNALGYLSYTPINCFTLRAGLDDVGYAGDAIFRMSKAGRRAAGFINLGLTFPASSSTSGYVDFDQNYFRAGLGGSIAPFSFGSDSGAVLNAAKLRIYGSVTWTQYPEWIDFSQYLKDSTGTTLAKWDITSMEEGETKIMAGGLSWESGIFVFGLGVQKAFQTKEKGVRVDLGSQPPYLVNTTPDSEMLISLRLGLRDLEFNK